MLFSKNFLNLPPDTLSVAQLVEQLTLNQWVPGSNPGGETKKKSMHVVSGLFCFQHANVFAELKTKKDRYSRSEHGLFL
jgi:hypothetical protein